MFKFEARNLRFAYRGRVLAQDVSFVINPGEALIIAGRSGCGKSMLLELCAGLGPSYSGEILWNDWSIRDMTRHDIMEARQKIGFVFQKNALIQNYPIAENIALPVRYHYDTPDEDVRCRVRELLGLFGLLDVAGHFPEALSAGQARCAALARALVLEPDMLFLDEPTGDVDPVTAGLIVRILKDLRARRKVTCLIISHHTGLAQELGCSVKVLDRGNIVDLSAYNSEVDGMFPELTSFLHGAV